MHFNNINNQITQIENTLTEFNSLYTALYSQLKQKKDKRN